MKTNYLGPKRSEIERQEQGVEKFSEFDAGRQRRRFDHAMHVNINKRQNALRKAGSEREHWLYEAKTLPNEIARLTRLFQLERAGELPTGFRYCPHSEVEQTPDNRLMCCLGKEPKRCEILLETFAGMEAFPIEMIERAKADVCATHILTESAKRLIDTSEGYVTDATDRAFWQRTYEGMAAPGPDENDGLRCPNCGDNDWETWYMKKPWFKAEGGGTQPGTPDGPEVHWAQGEQTCPMCSHKWFVQASD
jgi:DNA-directed RNA polymerase subunit RPC12/RpoP